MSAATARSAPSVSPLSSASRTKNSSPIAARDTMMQETGNDDDAADSEHSGLAATGDAEEPPDDRSSSLSEPEDDNEEEDRLNGVEDDEDEGQEVATHTPAEADSEAETERVEQTPQKQRKSTINLGRTPSKLNQTAAVDDELSDPPSPLPAGPGGASSTSTITAPGKKRKRSETVDSSLTSADSDLGESPPKRSHTSAAHLALDPEEEAIDTLEQPVESAEGNEETPLPDEGISTPLVVVRGGRGRKGKQKGRKPKVAVEETETENVEEMAEPEEEPSEESAAKTEEDLRQRKEASIVFEDVTKQFRAFREKLSTERLASLSAELELLAQPSCEHPEYLRQVACVDARLQKQRQEAHAFYTYRIRSIRDRTLGERSQLHSQFFQYMRQLREDVLDQLGEDWYAIQKERRQNNQDSNDAYIYKLPEKRSVQIRQQAKYNQEVSVLSGIAKYVGFPAAPDLSGVQGDDLDRDLKAMKISRRGQQQAQPNPPVYVPKPANSQVLAQNEKLAHDQFIEQTAWARPQAPVLTHGTPGISHTPDWAEPGTHNSAKGLARNLSSQYNGRASSPFATPVPQHRVPMDISSSGTVPLHSDGPEPPSSVLAAPPTVERMIIHHHSNGGVTDQQSSPIVLQKQRQNNPPSNELPGIRNVSGASTIDAAPDASEPASNKPVGLFPGFAAADGRPLRLHETSGGDDSTRDILAAAASFRPVNSAAFASTQ